MLARRRDATANAALSVGWRREDRVQVGTECGDRGEGLPELSLSGLHISRIFHWQGMGIKSGGENGGAQSNPVGFKTARST